MATSQTSSSNTPVSVRRKALKVAVSALCCEVGFQKAEENAIETLLEMLQSYITELGRSARAYCEVAGRTEPMSTDVIMAMVEMGCDVKSLPAYAKRENRKAFMPPLPANQPQIAKVLQAGPREPHGTHIPDYLPPFPDPHTYIITETYKQTANEYQVVREKAAQQKRDIEKGLIKFMSKTCDTHKLFQDESKESQEYSLIAPRLSHTAYLDALIPHYHHDLEGTETGQLDTAPPDTDTTQQDGQAPGPDAELITDNPYLRPIKMPRLKKRLS